MSACKLLALAQVVTRALRLSSGSATLEYSSRGWLTQVRRVANHRTALVGADRSNTHHALAHILLLHRVLCVAAKVLERVDGQRLLVIAAHLLLML